MGPPAFCTSPPSICTPTPVKTTNKLLEYKIEVPFSLTLLSRATCGAGNYARGTTFAQRGRSIGFGERNAGHPQTRQHDQVKILTLPSLTQTTFPARLSPDFFRRQSVGGEEVISVTGRLNSSCALAVSLFDLVGGRFCCKCVGRA